jgi:hypothetical protein
MEREAVRPSVTRSVRPASSASRVQASQGALRPAVAAVEEVVAHPDRVEADLLDGSRHGRILGPARVALDLRQLHPDATWAQLSSSLDGGWRSLPRVAGAWRRGWLGWAGGAILIAMGLLAVRSRTREALRYCRQRRHLRRTVRIALVVGVVLTAINQLDVIVSGDATTATWVKCGLNFLVPFVVSNLGLLSGRARQ